MMNCSIINRLFLPAIAIIIVIVGVVVSDMKDNRLFISFDVETEKSFTGHVFFSDNPSEPYKYNKPYSIPSGHTDVCVPINIKRLRKLRIDFGEFPGIVKSSAICIKGADDKEHRLKWNDFSRKHDIDTCTISEDGCITLTSDRRDPYLVYAPNLDIPSNQSSSPQMKQDIAVFSIAGVLSMMLISCMPGWNRRNAATNLLLCAIAIQLSLMATWMLFNLGADARFGDAKEYLSLSRSLSVDEYRPVGYPIIVACASWIGEQVHLPYFFFIYILQTIVSVFTALFAIKTIDRLFLNGRFSDSSCGIGTTLAALYLVTFPLCGMMNFAAMSDSLALSATILLLTTILRIFHDENCGWHAYAVTFIAFCGGSWIRGDRPFLFLASGLLVSLFWLIRGKGHRLSALKCTATLALSFTVVMVANRFTQKPGCHNRPRTTLEFVLLDRVVWPHMTECYDDFPQEVRNIVTVADAKNFDANNNNVMYVFAKKMNQQFGEARAHEIYRIMAETVFRTHTRKIICEMTHDVIKVLLAPFFQLAEVYNINCHKDSPCINPYCYNPRCFMQNTHDLTWAVNAIPLHLFALAFAFFLVRTVRRADLRKSFAKTVPVVATFFGFSLLLAIFYSLGDGAHPNSRYSIIVDTTWVLLVLLMAALQDSTPSCNGDTNKL